MIGKRSRESLTPRERVWIRKRLVELRKERGYTQQDLSQGTHYTRDHISRVESGRVNPSVNFLHDTAVALETTLEDLLSERYNRYLTIGRRRTQWVSIDGNGEEVYDASLLQTRLKEGQVPLPEQFARIKRKVEKEQIERKRRGEQHVWNGPLFALVKYVTFRTPHEESLGLILTFQRSDYYSFQATTVHPDATELRNNLLEEWSVTDQPIPFLAQGFGVSLVVKSQDEKIILTRRLSNVGVRPNELDVSIVEGLHSQKDIQSNPVCPVDLYNVARRGLREELGLSDDVCNIEVQLLGFGVDMQYYQWQIIGQVKVGFDAGKIEETHHARAKDRTEPIPSEPEAVFRYVSQKGMWSVGLATLYYSLVHEWGYPHVQSIAMKYFD